MRRARYSLPGGGHEPEWLHFVPMCYSAISVCHDVSSPAVVIRWSGVLSMGLLSLHAVPPPPKHLPRCGLTISCFNVTYIGVASETQKQCVPVLRSAVQREKRYVGIGLHSIRDDVPAKGLRRRKSSSLGQQNHDGAFVSFLSSGSLII